MFSLMAASPSDYTVNGEFNSRYNVQKENIMNAENNEKTSIINTLQLTAKYTKDNFRVVAVPFYFNPNVQKDNKEPNKYDTSEFFFRSLYMTYKMGDLKIGAGVLPFGNGFPFEYSKHGEEDGMGLSIMSEIDPLSAFISYNFGNNKILAALSQVDTKFIPSGNYTAKDIEKGSNGWIAIHEYNNGRFKMRNEVLYNDIKYNGKGTIAELYVAGTGMAWDDSENSGITIYDTFAMSKFTNNSGNFKQEIFEREGINPFAELMFPDNFSFDIGKTYRGSANLFGIRQDFDLFGKEQFVNFEWFKTQGHWASAHRGTPYTGNGNQNYKVRDNSYFVNYGLSITKDILMRVNYTYIEFKETGSIGFGHTIPTETYIGEQKDKAEIYNIEFSYRF
jgi:hypothetical protein